MLTRLKGSVQSLLTGWAELLHRAGLTPNQVSGLGILLAFAAGCFYWLWQLDRIFLVVAPLLFLLSGLCDALDGIIARLHGEATVFGGFLDSVLDRYADAFILVAVIIGDLCDALWGSVALTGSLLVSYTRARAEAAGKKMETIGLAERAERMIILAVASAVAFFWSDPKLPVNWGIILLAVLTNLTVLQRAAHFYWATRQK
jgi:archaetidylinositol phosphate synthase